MVKGLLRGMDTRVSLNDELRMEEKWMREWKRLDGALLRISGSTFRKSAFPPSISLPRGAGDDGIVCLFARILLEFSMAEVINLNAQRELGGK